jgi:leucyl aminopeptidase
MKISLVQKQIQALPADALIISLFEGAPSGAHTPSGTAGAVDSALGASDGIPGDGLISRLLDLGDFKGKLNEVALVYTQGMIPAPRVILVGLGHKQDLTLERVRQASGSAARKARDLGCKRVTSVIHGAGVSRLDVRAAAQATVEGAVLGAYQFREHKSGNGENGNGKRLDELVLVEFNPARVAAAEAGLRQGEAVAHGVNTARTLINRAPNMLHPRRLAAFAQQMAEATGPNIACTVLTEQEIAEQHMGGVLAVARGSARAPRFVILDYTPDGVPAADAALESPLVLVGKGVTFDSGGISLKDPAGMESMKADMGGAAAVIGALQAIAELKLPQRVIGLLPLVENMPSGRAFRPGDVITMMNGATVEIISTDAEGRLILADALHYAKRYHPRGVVDLATLTGACVVALGEGMAAGLFSNDDEWARALRDAAARSGERLWQLPLYPEYGDKIKSDVADMKNSGGRNSGVGSSAYFIKRFVETEDEDAYPWAHIDMASMMFNSETKGYQPRGAMGYGVRTLIELAQQINEQGNS